MNNTWKKKNKTVRIQVGFILLLGISWFAMSLITHFGGYLFSALTVVTRSDGSIITLVFCLPGFYGVLIGYVFALLVNCRNNEPENYKLSITIILGSAVFWMIPAIAIALWAFLLYSTSFVHLHPYYIMGSLFPNYSISCGVIGGIVLGSLRHINMRKTESGVGVFFAVIKILISAVAYFLLFGLSSYCVWLTLSWLYGHTNYGFGAYWLTTGNVIFFGALFGVLFRISQFSLRGRWVFRFDKLFLWVVTLAILVVTIGFVWYMAPIIPIPTFAGARGRVPDIAVIWMFMLGYLIGRNIERKPEEYV